MQTDPERVCRCGCGTALRGRRSEFAPGHHARLASPRPGGGLTPVRAPPGACVCGCGGQVKTLGGRFLPGHNHPRGEMKTCLCGTQVHVPPSRAKAWRACSLVCARKRGRRLEACAWNPLQMRALGYLATERVSFSELARRAEVPHSALREWFYQHGSTISERALRGLADVLGLSFEHALAEAGGKTSAQRRVEHARAIYQQVLASGRWPSPGTPAFQARQLRAARAKRSTPSAEATAARQATKQASGGYQRALDALIASRRTPQGRASSALTGRLLWRQPAPSKEEIQRWAEEVGARFGLRPDVVMAIWRPRLVGKGLTPAGGRPADTARCRHIRAELAKLPAGTTRLPYGWWKATTRSINTALGLATVVARNKMFWREHRCRACADVRLGRQTVRKLAA